MIASLRHEEIRALAVLHKHTRELPVDEPGSYHERGVAWTRTVEELVPAVFDSPDHLEATLQAASRTGLVVGQVSHPASFAGEPSFFTTHLMDTIAELAPFTEALAEEDLQF